ncbi:MAG: hypothetical protein J6R18_10405 [Kiritimatiellae bacterium]|nr:hypothetical protein [Kiritimatiellia bacterium]
MRNNILAIFALAVIAGCGVDDGSAEFEKAEAAYAARDLQFAANYYGAAAAKNPTNLAARVKLAMVNVDLGEISAARSAIDSALETDATSAEAIFIDGQIAFLEKDYKRANKAFASVYSAVNIPKPLRSRALAAQAVLELAENKFDNARVTLWRALRMDMRNAAAWYHLGYLSRDTYRFEDAALEQFQMASRLMTDPSRLEVVTQKIIPTIRESINSRIAAKPGASSRNPGAAAKLVSEGERILKRNPKGAEAKFAEAYAKDPLSYEAAWNFAKIKMNSAKTDKDVDKVLTAFQDAIDQRPNSQVTYRTAARFALNSRRPMRAEKFLSQALAHEMDNKASIDLYIQTLRRIGKNSLAKVYSAYLGEIK